MTYSKIIIAISLFTFTAILFTCSEDEVTSRSYPVIDTREVSDINSNGATLNAEILNAGSLGIADHGFVYANLPAPSLENSDKISLGEISEKGIFSAIANRNLTKDKKYYVKAYAITRTSNIIVYGQEIEFISLGSSAPEIDDFLPKQGVIGDTVLLTGSGFSNVISSNRVMFGDETATLVKATKDSIWCIVPTPTVVGENEVSLMLGQAVAKSENKFLLKAMSMTSFTPNELTFGDTLIINGTNFPMKELITVNFLGKDVKASKSSSTQLKLVVSNETVIPESPVLIKAGVQTVSSVGNVKMYKPVITNFTPIAGTKDTEITVNGNYFNPVNTSNKVEVNGKILSVVESSRSVLKLKVPGGINPGKYPLTITIANQVVTSSSPFEILKPVISTVSPLSATWGNTITISGKNFGSGINDNIVSFGTVQASVISASSTELKVKVPDGLLTKSAVITVQALTIDNLSTIFVTPFSLKPPVITSFTPDNAKSNSQVTIHGANFNPIQKNQLVKFGDREVEVISSSSSQLIVKLPTSLIDSDVPVRIDVAEQYVIASQLFHFVSPWRRLADFPGNERMDAVSYSIGDYGYIGLGTKASLIGPADTWKYDTRNNTWSSVATFFYFVSFGGGDPVDNAAAFVISNKAYVGTGDFFGVRNEVSSYDPTNDMWINTADPEIGLKGTVGYSINGRGYFTSGNNSAGQLDYSLLQYDPVSDSWSRKADFPGTPRTEATGFSVGEKAYLLTGSVGNTYLKDLWVYDTSLDKWKQLNNFPGSAREQSSGFSINGLGYTLGGLTLGVNSDRVLRDVWMYNPNTDTWTKLEDFPGAARFASVTFVVNGKAYYATGYGIGSDGPGLLKDLWEFDPSKL